MIKLLSNKMYFPFLIISKLLGFVFQLIISRLFGQEVFGQLSYASAVASITTLLNDLSISQQVIRSQADNNNNKFIMIILLFKTLLSILILGIFYLIFNPIENQLLFFIAYLIIFSLVPSWYFVLNKKQYLLELVNVINIVFLIIVAYLTQKFFFADIFVLSFLFIGVSFLSLLISLYFIKPTFKLYVQDFFSYLSNKKKSIFYLTSTMLIAKIYYDMDIFIIEYYYSFDGVAEYSYAFKYFALFYVLYGTYVSFFFPIVSRVKKQVETMNFTNIINLIFMLVSLLVVFGIFLSPYLISLIAGKEVESSVLILKILFVTALVVFLKTVFGNFILSFGYDKQLFKLSILGAVINFFLNIVFIPLYGVIAAAITTLITELILTLFEYRYFLQEYNLPFPMIQFIVLIISIFASIYFAYMLIPILIYLLFSLKNYKENIKYIQRFLNA